MRVIWHLFREGTARPAFPADHPPGYPSAGHSPVLPASVSPGDWV